MREIINSKYRMKSEEDLRIEDASKLIRLLNKKAIKIFSSGDIYSAGNGSFYEANYKIPKTSDAFVYLESVGYRDTHGPIDPLDTIIVNIDDRFVESKEEKKIIEELCNSLKAAIAIK